MPVSDDVLARAKRGDRRAVEAVLLESFPSVNRMAHALTGRPATAARLIRLVLQRGVRVLPTWRKGMIPENWFYHHTLLAARQVEAKPPDSEHDLLVTAGPTTAAEYTAFVRALRNLPRQQTEAFVLHHGERLNPRLLGVAMDCSTQAASTHLAAATAALEAISGGQLPQLTEALSRAYAQLTPPEKAIHASVQKQVSAVVWRKRVRRMVRRLILLVILGAVAYAGWRYRDTLLQWIHAAREKIPTRPS